MNPSYITDQDKLIDFMIPLQSTLLDAAYKIQKNCARAVLVTEDKVSKKVLGIVSEGDILRSLLSGHSIHSSLDVCVQHGFKYLVERIDYEKAWELVRNHNLSLIPVLGKGFELIDVLPTLELYSRLKL